MLLIGRINFLLGLHYSRDSGFIIKSESKQMNNMSLSQIYTFMFLSAFKFNMFMGFWGFGV